MFYAISRKNKLRHLTGIYLRKRMHMLLFGQFPWRVFAPGSAAACFKMCFSV